MQEFTVTNRKGQTIVGELHTPEQVIKGTCIVQHGRDGTRNDPIVRTVEHAFFENGFLTFNFDTTNSYGASDGDYEKATLGLHWEDFEDVVSWAKQQPWFAAPLVFAGHSMGGYASLRYAQEYPDEVSGVVALAPVISGELSFIAYERKDPEGFKKWKEEGSMSVTDKATGTIKIKHWFQMEERLNHDLLQKAQFLSASVLLIAAKNDSMCPPSHIEKLYKNLPDRDKEMAVIDEATHIFKTEAHRHEVFEYIKEWLKHRY